MPYNENTPGPKPTSQSSFLSYLYDIKNKPESFVKIIHELNYKLNEVSKDSCRKLSQIIKEKNEK